jgi:hypothetical protein
MQKIISVKPLHDYHLQIQFQDKYVTEFDVKPFINGGISDALLDEKYFQSVFVDEFGGITWPNGYDFCPNFLREYALDKIELKAA